MRIREEERKREERDNTRERNIREEKRSYKRKETG